MTTLDQLRHNLRTFPFAEVVDVNGVIDNKTGIKYIGNAYRQPSGMYRCLANVNGALCRVEVSLRVPEPIRFVGLTDEAV